jgi:isopenicillin N synthase-like dioxygenase
MHDQDDNHFPNNTPFPSTVPTAPLLRISLAKLLTHDPEEEGQLWNACCDLGFFYLDLRTRERANLNCGANGHVNGVIRTSNGSNDQGGTKIDGDSLLDDADALFEVAEEFFELPVDEKAKYDFADQGSYFG